MTVGEGEPGGDERHVVIEPVHYGAGVRTFTAAISDDVTMHPSFEAAIEHWRSLGWGRATVVDDTYGRYLVQLQRVPPAG